MNNIAFVVLDGNLVHDPEIKKIGENRSVVHFSIAVNYETGSREDQKSVSYFPIEAWDRTAENCATFLQKGSRVTINGYLKQDRWKDDNGKTQSRVKIVANSVRFDGKIKGKEKAA